ncbi:orotidine-5'-phosphate decarboxylase [Neobacillus vireti]|uniref:Orotidine 5'-phosphate decarboxylase n=1 Tax=Neobacillus vireti LMG 21834 TaxID=1131730 RepID=A0AB94IIM4_9BACI|nr:orotidine-5'-phosphate decarboxylase [Neobacillus vireti]ETI66899.1 orotidine 5'-phosphate decarboxylase [Neobacillus vireti LMG 21834]KLT19474.1 orotidine 5'-phosphate decarboxylase [Neobacillus vireti]
MDNSLIIALDFANKSEAERFLAPFEERRLFLKVGMELFYKEGPAIVHLLKEKGHQIFLDLKLHDIPNTVRSAMKGLARMECDLVNVHAAGGREMMQSALEGLEAGTATGRERPNCIAVTQLTSTSQEQMNCEQLIPVTLDESVLHYASLAKNAGLDGVVCSARESESIHSQAGSSFLTVCPGIRMESDQVGDQKRVATPEFARRSGVSAIVVGRSITRSADPVRSYEQWMNAWRGVHK